jgi:hypothetical protein
MIAIINIPMYILSNFIPIIFLVYHYFFTLVHQLFYFFV